MSARSGLLGAWSLLTRVPVGASHAPDADLGRAVPWFPAVGAIVGGLVALVYAGGHALLPPAVAAGLAIATGILLTGGLHEDGLGDTADAFGGASDRAGALRILKDPRQGTFGVLALVLSVVLRVFALASLGSWDAAAVLPGAHALSRAGAVALMGTVPSVGEGLGASYARRVGRVEAGLGIASGLVLAGALMGAGVILAAGGVALSAALVGWLSVRKIGGVTGDVLGATQQVGEIAVLLVAAALVGADHSWAWWAP